MNLFTICIPTYNRCGFLEKALNALLPQVALHAVKGVGVYVSNNCSTDGTEGVVRKYQEKYPGLIQYKCQVKMNPQHFTDVVQSVKSRYIALMGDDDFVMPGYVERILRCIEERPDVGLINYNIINYYEGLYQDVRDPMFVSGQGKLYLSGGEFVKEHHHCASLMSSNVFVLEDYLKAQSTIVPDTYPGYDWYAALLKGVIHKPCYYIDAPLVWANCPPCVSWEESALKVYMCGFGRLFKDLDAECSGLYDTWCKVFESTWFKEKCLFLARKYRNTTSREFYKDIEQYAYSPEYAKQLRVCIFYPQLYSRLYFYFKNKVRPFIKRHFSF